MRLEMDMDYASVALEQGVQCGRARKRCHQAGGARRIVTEILSN